MNGELGRIIKITGLLAILIGASWTARSYVDMRIENHGHADVIERLARIEERILDIQKTIKHQW